MKYFLDSEFLEGKQKENFPISLFRKETPNTIDLISIGIVAEDGREFYAISKDFNLKEAWNRYDLKINKHYPMGPEYLKEYWIRENVLRPVFYDLEKLYDPHEEKEYVKFNYKNLKRLLQEYGKTNKQIAEEVKEFCNPPYIDLIVQDKENNQSIVSGYTTPEFYAYYADYDWCVFCWLFGKMIDLPKDFPMYCRDLKQMIDEQCDRINKSAQEISPGCPLVTHKSMKENDPRYPKPTYEHNALSDAKFNLKLYKFLQAHETNP